jgi:DNA recombination protein RmuC
MNITLALILGAAAFTAILVLLILLLSRFRELAAMRQELHTITGQQRQEMSLKIDNLARDMNRNSQTSFQTIQRQYSDSVQMIQDVTKKLTEIGRTNQQILDFSGQLQSLENILRNPKQRGIMGEYFLEAMLSNVLAPEQYTMQYTFANNDRVDAAIFYNDTIIPIDAKFSLEKYNRMAETTDPTIKTQLDRELRNDLKERINETSKYIRPGEGTTDFAFMFIPAEGIYYSLLTYTIGNAPVSGQDLIEYAYSKHVIIVSPTSFFAYLETVLQGLKAQKVQKNIQDIIKRISILGDHIKRFHASMEKLGGNLGAAVNTYNRAAKELKLIDTDVYRITGEESGEIIELVELERPVSGDD